MKTGLYFIIFILSITFSLNAQTITICASPDNDLFVLLQNEGFQTVRYDTPEEAVEQAGPGASVIITARDYPCKRVQLPASLYKMINKKRLRVYLEYPESLQDIRVSDSVHVGKLERGVVSSKFFGAALPELSLLGINDCHIPMIEATKPLISFAKVAGFDKADYGLTDTEVYPLLFQQGNMMIAASSLSNFRKGRFEPVASWQIVWEHLLAWLTRQKSVTIRQWPADPRPSYTADAILPVSARKTSVRRGSDWFFNGRFLLHPSWQDTLLKYQGDGRLPFGPPASPEYLIGDGSLGILEGHASNIYYDGRQQYRYWLRADVQGEVSFSLASAGKLLNDDKYRAVSEKLIDYIFYTSKFRSAERNDKNNPAYGLIGWSDTHPHIYYNDDNARLILGVIGASAFLDNERWNRYIVENILANFRTCSKQGFQGRRLDQQQIEKNGWQYYFNRDFVNPHPHFESWMWACYLWLYNKTGYKPLLDKAKSGIRIMMEAYPDEWKWTNGIQQERARMTLCLAWLVKVEDTPEHRKWLDLMVQKLLENQQPNGAIREELGGGTGQYGRTKSNKAYGLHEAPLISVNGDPVSDMLYTCNFAFFGLNEAAQATNNPVYKEAVDKLSGFLTRIQVKSETHPDLDGAWFRAFEYNRWDYWASNADIGWGAWCTLTGWIQSWIVATQVLLENNQSFWDATQHMDVKDNMKEALWMLEEKNED